MAFHINVSHSPPKSRPADSNSDRFDFVTVAAIVAIVFAAAAVLNAWRVL
jgi:hypothetical protein